MSKRKENIKNKSKNDKFKKYIFYFIIPIMLILLYNFIGSDNKSGLRNDHEHNHEHETKLNLNLPPQK